MRMDAEHSIECSCELCRPNWYLGRDDEFAVAPESLVSEAELARQHAQKIQQAGLVLDFQPQT